MRLVDVEDKDFLSKIELNFGPTVRPLLKKILSEAPIVDAVPVVRCKDCQHSFEDDFDGSWWCCRDIEREVVADHFCSYGERRSE